MPMPKQCSKIFSAVARIRVCYGRVKLYMTCLQYTINHMSDFEAQL